MSVECTDDGTIIDNPNLVSFPFDVKAGTETEMAEFLNDYIDSVEPSIDFESKATYTSSLFSWTYSSIFQKIEIE